MTTLQLKSEDTTIEEEKRARLAFRLLLALGLIIAVASSIIIIRAIFYGDLSSDLLESGSGVIAGLLCLVGAALARRNHVTAAIALVTIALFGMDMNLIYRLSAVGLPLTIILTIILILIASQTLSPLNVTRGIVLIFSIGALILILDQFWPFERGVITPVDLQIIYIFSFIMIGIGFIVVIRQFPTFSLRSKLMTVTFVLVFFSVFLTTVVSNYVTRQTLTEQLNREFRTISQSQSAAFSELLGRQVEVLQTLGLDGSLESQIQEQNLQYQGTDEDILQEILLIDKQWIDGTDEAIVNFITNNVSASKIKSFNKTSPAHVEIFVTDKYGALVGASNRTTDYYQADEPWWQAAYNNGVGNVFIGEPAFDESSGVVAINIAIPVFFDNGDEIVGILRTTYEVTELTEFLAATGTIGEGGHIDLLFKDFSFHLEDEGLITEDSDYVAGLLDELQDSNQTVIAQIEGEERVANRAPITTFGQIPAIDNLGWSVVISQAESVAFATITAQQQISIILALVAIIVGSILATFFARLLTSPINRLTDTAVLIAGGDINQQAPVETQDEIGTLAAAFNNMTAQLRNFIGTLEDRVLDRTKALATSSEVSRQLSTILDQDELVNEVVNQIRDSFNFYHAQIYLFDEKKEYLHMVGGTGTAGKKMLEAGHKLGPNQGLVGRAAATNQIILISDVAKNSAWLSNEMLPDTRAEAAIPIALGDNVLGVLDVQHNIPQGLDEESAQLLQSIANQVAIALQNARQITQTKEALAESSRLQNEAEEQARRLAQLNEMSAALNTAKNEEEIYRILGMQISTVLHEDFASLAFIDEATQMIQVTILNPESSDEPSRFQVPAKNSIVTQVIQDNRLIYLPQDGKMSDFDDSQTLEPRGFHSMMVAPMTVGNSILGTFNLVSRKPYAYEESDIYYVRQIATILATILENQRVNARANLLASIVENHPDFIGVGTLEGQALYINPSGRKLISLSADKDVTTMTVSDFYSPADTDLLINEGISAAIEAGVWSTEVNLLTQDGGTIPVEETIGINYDADNNPTEISVTMRDIRERKQAEEAIRQSEQLALDFQEKLTKIHEISTSLSALDDLEDIYRSAIELGRGKLDFDRIGLFLFDDRMEYMVGTYGTNDQGEIQSEDNLRHDLSLSENQWVLNLIKNKERRYVNHDVDLYDNNQPVGRGWNIVAIVGHEDTAIGWLATDNLLKQRPLLPYEPELFTIFAATLANIIYNKRAAQSLAKRAQELQAVAEVSRIATTILDRVELLRQVADLTKEKFNLYHVHIYSLSQDKQTLLLAAGAGEIGQIMVAETQQIPLRAKQSLVAQAARLGKGVIVNDVQAEPGFLQNPLLPDTRAELATPLISGDELLGVLDIQSDVTNQFDENDINIQTTLASQIANAIQNANQYQRAQAALEELTRMQQMLIREGWETFLTSREKPLQGYLYEEHELRPLKKNGTAVNGRPDQTIERGNGDTAVYSDLTVRGATIGTLGVRDPSGQPVSPEKQLLLTSISQQVAEALERARLFEETEIARTETEVALDEVRTLLDISAQLNAATSLEEALAAASAPGLAQGALSGTLFTLKSDEYGQPTHAVLEASTNPNPAISVGTRIELELLPSAQLRLASGDDAMVVEDVEHEENLDPAYKEYLLQTNTKAYAVMTLAVGQRQIGVIYLRWPEPHSFTEADKRLYSSIATQAAAVMDSILLLEEIQERATELQETTGFLDSVIENLPVMLFVKDADDLSFIRWNKTGTEITGLPPEAFLGKTDYDLFPKEEADFFAAKDREVLDSGQTIDIPDEPLQTAHQGTRILHTRKVPIKDVEGNPKYLLGISEDITERRQAEMAMAKRAVELQTVAEISTSVGATLDTEQLLNEVVDLTWANFGLYHVNLYLLDQTGDSLELAASAGTIGAQMVADGHAVPLQDKKSIVAKAATLRQGIIINDVENEKGFKPNPLLPLTRSELAVPLLAGNKVMGVLEVFSEEVHHFSSQDVNIQTTLASQIATTLDNARLFTQTQARATELATINAINTVAATQLNLNALLASVGERLQETFKAQAVYIALYDENQKIINFPYFNDKDNGSIYMEPRFIDSNTGGFTAQIIEKRQPLLSITSSSEDAQEQGAQITGGGRVTDTYLGVPMILGDRLIGVIGMSAYKEDYIFSEEDKRLMGTLANTVGVAIQNAQQFELTQRRAERERVVNEITQKIQSTLSVEAALQTAVQELGIALKAKNAEVELKLDQQSAIKSNGSKKKAG